MKFLKENQTYIVISLLIIIFLRTCSLSIDNRKLKSEQERIVEKLDSMDKKTIDGPSMDEKLEGKMWQALELEEMGDKGKSINELKNQYKKK